MFKSLSHDVKEVNIDEGVVEAYANVYDFEDSDGDISMQGSFNKAVTDGFKRIRVLKDHDRYTSIGVPTKIDTSDPYGLKTETQFNMKKGIALDVLSDIALAKKHGLNAELSIGYGLVKRDNSNKKMIKEYGWLGEYSFLSSWAANEKATVQSIKSLGDLADITEVMAFLETMYNLKHSDPRLKEIELVLEQIEKTKDAVVAESEQKEESITSILFKNLYLTI